MFGIALVVLVYMAGYSWYLGGPAINQSIPWLYSSAIISGASLFVLSFVYHSGKHRRLSSPQRLLLALFDLATYFCGVTLILWGLILPILRPITSPTFQLYLLDQQSLSISIYTGLILCSLVVIFRVALQFMLLRNNSYLVPAIIPALPAPESVQTKGDDRKSIEDSLSLIRSELAMLREQVSSLGRIAPAGVSMHQFSHSTDDNQGWSSIGEVEPIPFAISEASRLPTAQAEPVRTTTDIPITTAFADPAPPLLEYEPTNDVRLPDSAKDNPWASVLSRRETNLARIHVEPSIPVVAIAPAAAPSVTPEKKSPATRRARKGRGKNAKKVESNRETPAPVNEVTQPQLAEVPATSVAQNEK